MGRPSTSSSARDSKRDVTGSETSSLRSSGRSHDSSSSSSSRRRSRSRSPKAPKSRREMPRKRKSTGGEASSSSSSSSPSTAVAAKSGSNSSTFGISPTALFSNLQSAYNVFQSLPNLAGVGGAPTAAHPNGVPSPFTTSYEFALPNTPVTNLLSPSNLHLPASQEVLQARLATNLPRHGNAYAILLVGTLLTSHWLVLAAVFGIVKSGLFIQSYNGRDIARDLGVRKYASSQAIMSGFAAAAALVALWAFSSVFSVVATVIKVATLVLAHAAFFELDEAAQRRQQQQGVPSGGESVVPPTSAPQGVLRPASTSLSPRDAVALLGQIRSVSEGHLSTVHSNTNGWYAGEGYVGGNREDEYAARPRVSEQFPPSPRIEEHDVADGGVSWGFNEAGRPQSYASGRSY